MHDKALELAAAEDHIRRGETLVGRQRAILARLAGQGLRTDVAADLLDKLEITLSGFLDHRDLLRREIAEAAALRDSLERKRAPTRRAT